MTSVPLTAEQQAAVLYTGGDQSILAAAGSGKTFVMVEKIALLSEKWHVPPEKILVVTFTEKAAEEMRTRLHKRLGNIESLNRLTAGTIHGVAAALLKEGGGLPDFSVMEDSLAGLERIACARAGLLKALEGEEASEALGAVERFGFTGARRLFLDLWNHRVTDEDHDYARVFRGIRELYERRKNALKFLDFNDLEDRLLSRLAQDEDFREKMQRRFDWIFVDEFQDTSPVQWEILSRLHSPGKNRLVIVGDPRQSIYRFRGADPSLFAKVTDVLVAGGGRRFDLTHNFRSAPQIIDFVNDTGDSLFEGRFPALIASRTDAGVVELLSVPLVRSEKELSIDRIRALEAQAVGERLKELRTEGHVWKSMALLFRTRKAVKAYQDAFARLGIPCRTSFGEALLEQPEILAAVFSLKKYAGPAPAEMGFVELGLSHSRLKDFSEPIPVDPLLDFLKTFFEKISLFFPESPYIAPFEKLTGQLLTLGISSLPDLLKALDVLREEGRITAPSAEISEDAVRLMTVHAAKGLEFSVVVLCDLQAVLTRDRKPFLVTPERRILLKERDESVMGLKNKLKKGEDFQEAEESEHAAEDEESKRLLYVALTRARDRLLLPLPLSRPDAEKKKKRAKSRNWSEWLLERSFG